MSHFSIAVFVPPDVRAVDVYVAMVMLPFHEYEATGIQAYLEDIDATEDCLKLFRKENEGMCFSDFLVSKDVEVFESGQDMVPGKAYYMFALRDLEQEEGYRVYERTNPKAIWDYYGKGGPIPLVSQDRFASAAYVDQVDLGINREIYEEALDFWAVVVDKTKAMPEGDEAWEEVYGGAQEPSYYLERYGTAEEYASCRAAWRPYGFIDLSGKLRARGKMGWGGLDDVTRESRRRYEKEFCDYMKAVAPDTMVVCLDCHI